MIPAAFDMTFIGSGLSCTYTLIHLINQLSSIRAGRKIRLLILEKNEEFWTGIPYGNRSGYTSLIISPLKDFIPESESPAFLYWFTKNLHWIFNDLDKNGGDLSAKWLRDNEQNIHKQSLKNLYLPRYIFGYYLKERINTTLTQAVNEGLIEYELCQTQVSDIAPQGNSYRIITENSKGERRRVLSRKVILSVGSPPKQPIIKPEKHNPTGTILYIDDIYEPGIEENMLKIFRNIKHLSNNAVLVIGSNASALEVIYQLNNRKNLTGCISRFYIISPDGQFPHRIDAHKDLSHYTPFYLNQLKNHNQFSAKQIFEAAKKDVRQATREGIEIANITEKISEHLVELIDKLSFEEQKEFVYHYGVEIGKIQRRAGAEYRDVIDQLKQMKKIRIIKGRFLEINTSGQVNYLNSNKQIKQLLTPLSTIINCSGFQNLQQSSSPLLKNLIRRNICRSNESKRGFMVNEQFEASKNFYVIGPLLAGNINRKLRVWHAESCPRIISLSKQLAENLLN